MMLRDTAVAILSDPEFDPSEILNEALISYMETHLDQICQMKGTTKHLVKDETITELIADHIDVNDRSLLSKYIAAIKPRGGLILNNNPMILLKLLHKIDMTDAQEELCRIVINNATIRNLPSMKTFSSTMKHAIFMAMCNCSKPISIRPSICWLDVIDVSYENISLWIKTLNLWKKDSPEGVILRNLVCIRDAELLNRCAQKWPALNIAGLFPKHTCLKCMRIFGSASGLKLHKRKCDPDNTFLAID